MTPGREGQLIVDELLDYLGYAGKVERVYVNDNIEKNIVKAFDKLVPNDSCRGAGTPPMPDRWRICASA